MSGIQATPFARKVTNQPVAVEDTLKVRAQEGWRRELEHRVHISQDGDRDFLRKYVPSNTPYPFMSDLDSLAKLFADWSPVAGKEKESYPHLTKGLNALVSSFPPAKRPAFFDCHNHQQSFPFATFAENHSITYPDLAATLPGLSLSDLPSKPEWPHFSIILEGKGRRQDDPFNKEGLEHCNTLVQLAINARCLMHAHGLLAAFVIGVYGDIVRIARFDHSCAVVSRRLSLKKATHLKVIQQFFWNFVNPCDGHSMVGCDPTVRQLTNDDKEWLYHRLVRVGMNPKEVIAEEARWAQVFDDDNSEPKSYVMFKALDVNGRLFSRSTTVWLALRDTRQWIHGSLVDDPQPDDLKLRIIKEAWRQLVRRPEDEYYARLDVIPKKDKVGLSSLLCGGDLGEREVRQWEHALYGSSTPRNGLDSVTHQSRLTTATSATHAPVPPSLTSTTTSVDQPPSHRPMQQTFTWRLARGPEYWHRERSHMRFVVDIVGRPLTAFRSTKELVTAIYHAVKGHRLAMTKAGVLHRDVSVGNILIVDNPDDQAAFSGFLHDFDYSSMSRDVPSADCDSLGAAALAEKLVADADAGILKERTGTFYFMATTLLGKGSSLHCICHDLEAFFWVLLWVVVRHVEHSGGSTLCADIFSNESIRSAVGGKMMWLTNGVNNFSVPGNAPLTKLIKELAALISANLFTNSTLDYDAFLAPLEEALECADWPEGDESKPYKMAELRTHAMGWDVPPKVAGSKRKTQEYDPDEEFSDRGDDDDMAIASDAEEMQVEYLLFSQPPDDDLPTVDVSPAPVIEEFRKKSVAASRSKRRKTGSQKTTQSSNTGSSATGVTASSSRFGAASSMAPSIASSRTSFDDTGSAASQVLDPSSGKLAEGSDVAPKRNVFGSQGRHASQASRLTGKARSR